MASTPSAPSSAVKAAAVLPVPPTSAVALVSVVARQRRAPVPAARLRALQGGNARRGAALVASAALDDLRPAIIDADHRAYLESQIVTSGQVRYVPSSPHPPTIHRPGRSRINSV